MPQEPLAALSPERKSTKTNSVAQHEHLDPQLFINLILILETYLAAETTPGKPFLIKDGVKIIL